MFVSIDQTLDECSELLHIFIHIVFNLYNRFIQAVIAVSSVPGVHFQNSAAKIFVRYDLLINSNSFHQGYFFLLVASQLFQRRGLFQGDTWPEVY